MTDLRIRPARPGDLDAVLAFWKTAAEGTSISDDRHGVEGLVARDPEALILAEHAGALVGTVIAGFDGWRCHLYRLAVHPERRRSASPPRCWPPRRNGSSGSAGAGATRWSCSATPPPSTHGGRRGTPPRNTGVAG